MKDIFTFKEFKVAQDQCAMKVGTDGVLLGAWTSLDNLPESILDIGAGTGVISLQLAQRSDAMTIDAVEIDDLAHQQCMENFEASAWGDRLFCYHASIQEYASEIEESYDLIVSNPPFYSEDYKTEDSARDLARFTEALPFQHLMVCAAHLLSETGIFSLIIPFKEEDALIALAQTVALFPNRICRVRGTETSAVKRSMIEFSFTEKPIVEESLTIELARHQYTEEYQNLVSKFYLKM
ncbi:MAG: methyltransferase [Flavobacteriaceae bacterium]|nr:methyltransferase [Flavobacteriaceae bacterium]